VWAANLAALELHVPQWSVDRQGRPLDADLLVIDLDPGEPATVVQCCEVAVALRTHLEAEGLRTYAKTSGSKGLQLYAPIRRTPPEQTNAFAHAWAERLERELPDLVVSRMTKSLRTGKVLVDWSQNNGAKTTIAPYSLRARPLPTVSAPVTWEEVEACRRPEDLRLTATQVLSRVAEDGDLLADLAASSGRPRLPGPPSAAG
jgi:bifunctional non-homologous end joining protein LigD